MTDRMATSPTSDRAGASSSGSPSSGTDSDGVVSARLPHDRLTANADEKAAHQPLPPQYWRPRGDSIASTSDSAQTPMTSGVQGYWSTGRERDGPAFEGRVTPLNAAADTAAPRKKRKRKYRKGTHTIRKEEIAALHDEIAELRTHLEDLKTSSFPSGSSDEPESEQDREFREKIFSNRLLRRAIHQQQIKFAPVHAAMTRYTLSEAEGGCPLHQFMHLGNDEHLRQTALNAMKTSAINRGKQFLQRRWPQAEPWRPVKEEHYFESSTGDYNGISMATMPFRKITSVKSAFDAVLGFFNNLEISASEQFGSITIREDTDTPDSGIAQNRLVTTAPSGLRMESNTIFFSCYYDVDSGWGDQPEHGIVICDFVDHDTRYPYHPRQRIRRDVCAVIEVKKHFTRDSLPPGELKEAVVLTRWVQTRLHLPRFEVEPEHWDQLCEKMERWVHILQPKLLEGIE